NISTRNIYAGFFVDGSSIGVGSKYTSIGANESTYITRTWMATSGTHNVTAIADPSNNIPEVNETNNELTKSIPYIKAPDLIIANITWKPETIYSGNLVTFNASIKNIGESNISSQNIYAGFYIDGNYIGSNSKYTSLAVNESDYITKTWTSKKGSHNVTVIADYNDYISESNESNNNNTKSIYIIPDPFAPTFSKIKLTPEDVNENTENVTFEVYIFDEGEGVNTSTATLYYSIEGPLQNQSLRFTGGNQFKTTLNKTEVDFDFYQGKNLSFYVSAKDFNNNFNSSPVQKEYIEVINDPPIITIYAPNHTSIWGGTNLINWSVLDDEGAKTNSTVYYWRAFFWAPSYEDNASEYFTQGQWIKLIDTNITNYLWNTTGLNDYSKIKIEATDGVNKVTKLSEVFLLDNTPVNIIIDNYFHNPSNAYLVASIAKIFGGVDAEYSNISTLEINDTNFTLTKSPVGFKKANYTFTSISNLSGNFSLRINSTDVAGNYNEISANFIVDDKAPVIEYINFSNAYTYDLVKISVNASDNFAINSTTARVPVLNIGYTNISLSYNEETGLYEATFFAPEAAGTYNITVFAVDMVGNSISSDTLLLLEIGPDLTLTSEDITFDPSTTSTGKVVNITALIHNIGG
ncbi:MAG: CARDB domain-containing protein, partial [Methanosarcinales archaeon]